MHSKLLNYFVTRLCEECNSLTEEQANKIIYDGRNPKARELAEWWDQHLTADELRKQKEMVKKQEAQDKEKALSKLTDYERKLLGLD